MAAQDTSRIEKLVIDPRWRFLPMGLILFGGLFGLIGAFVNTKQFAYSYLLSFMFFLSLCLGAMFLVIVHHLFDAAWSVPIRRVAEHIAFLLPVMLVLFIPIAILAKPSIYTWMQHDPHADHALHAKQPIFTLSGFYIIAAVLFAVWWWLSWSLRKWSLEQDRTGAALCTYKMRKLSAGGIYLFALTLTLAAIMWMKALEHQWFSTMYGVYYFAASVWVTLATLYLIAGFLKRTGSLSGVIHTRQMHDIGVLLFAFTVFYAYIAFSQYFLIWNAAMPEETFWYVKREQGSWWQICMILIFGHFALPFLLLLRIDAKLSLTVMIPLCVWVWVMHFIDMSFNIIPLVSPKNFQLHILDIVCMMFFAGVLSLVFIKYYKSHPPYPIKDPRLGEALGVHHAGTRAPAAAAD
jgi:hypothetical protein